MIDKYKLYTRTFFVLFWVAMCIAFVSEELIPPLASIRNHLMLGLDAVLLILGIILTRSKKDRIFIGTFLVIALISNFFLNRLPFTVFFNGLRDFFGLLFVIPVLRTFLTGPRAYQFRDQFDKQLKIWLLLQAICLVWQFLKYGANDHGGGTIGFGGSGMVSMLIYIVSYYLVIQRWDFNDYKTSLLKNKWYLLALIPTFLNETKVSFIMIVVYAILLYKPTKETLLKLIYVIPVLVLLGIGVMKLYVNTTNQEEDEVFSWEFITSYIKGDEGEIDYFVDLALLMQDGFFDDDLAYEETAWAVDIQRMAKIVLVLEPLKKTGGGLIFGAGIGQFKGLTLTDMTPFMREYKWLLQGSRPWVFFMGVQLGLMGLIWFFLMFFSDTYFGYKSNGKIKRMGWLIFTAFAIMMFYNDAFRYYYFCMTFFYVVFAIRCTEKANVKNNEEA